MRDTITSTQPYNTYKCRLHPLTCRGVQHQTAKSNDTLILELLTNAKNSKLQTTLDTKKNQRVVHQQQATD